MKNHFMEYKLSGDERAYISPELLGFLNSNKYVDAPGYPRAVNKHLAEMFCIGMTLLSAGTLTLSMMKCFSVSTVPKSRGLKT